MQDKNKKNAKKKRELVYKPYQKGNWHGAGAVKRALRLLAFYAAFAFLNLVAGTALQFDNALLRVIANALLLLVCCAVIYMDGAKLGEDEVARGEIVWTRKETGKEVTKQDLDRCYHPLKGVFIAVLAMIPFWILTVPHALTAKEQTYMLQSLPSWVSGYQGQSELMAPLAYYQQQVPITVLDIVRVIDRLLIFPFVGMANAAGASAVLTVDRLSPLLVCVPAAAFPLGYLTGPRSRAMVHGDIKTSATRYRKRAKKAARQRRERAAKKNELV